MKIKALDERLSVCQVEDYSQVDFGRKYCFAGTTDEENSLVCPTEAVPANTVKRDDGWRAFRIQGVLDFSLVGILSRIAGLLAEQGIAIFALSTYNTDYVLVKEEQYGRALEALKKAGYEIL